MGHQEYKKSYPDQFRYDYAVSREQKNAAGQKMYIQTKMAEFADELWELMQSPKTHIYMCGLKGMESGMEECFSPLAEKAGVEWKDFAKGMKKAHRRGKARELGSAPHDSIESAWRRGRWRAAQ